VHHYEYGDGDAQECGNNEQETADEVAGHGISLTRRAGFGHCLSVLAYSIQ
jgi:hypothetical protein